MTDSPTTPNAKADSLPDEHSAHGAPGRTEHPSGLEHEHRQESGHEHHGHLEPGPGHSHEHHHHGHPPEFPPHAQEVVIQIDRAPYREIARDVTGAEIRRIPVPHIPPDRDLFEVVPGAPDRKVLDDTIIRLREGQRFFTAPGQINPGSGQAKR